MSKIIEKVVASRLIHYLELNHLDEPLQSAYKRFHSCETALVRIQNDVLRAVDNRCCVVLLLLDLSAAFDTVDYNLLLSGLESKFAIRGKALQWFKSFLSQRSQFVRIDLDKSLSHEFRRTFFTHHLWLTFSDATTWFSIFTLKTPSCMFLSPAMTTWDYNVP